MEKKKIFLITIVAITIVCIITGTIIHYKNIKKNVDYIFNSQNHYSWEDSNDYSNSNVLDNFNKINIDAKIMNVNITSGDSFSIETHCDNNYLKPNVKVINSELLIEQKSVKHRNASSNQNCYVTIRIPKNAALNEIEIESNISKIMINDITANEVDLENNIGEIYINDVVFNELDAESNIGEISVNFPDDINDYNIKLNSNVGNINVNGEDYRKSYNRKGLTFKELKVSTNIGEIKIL